MAKRPRLYTPPARRALITPEGVALHLELASRGERFGAFILDLVLMFAALIGLTLLTILLLFGSKGEAANPAAIIWLLGFFAIRTLYFIGFETRPRAATPGKRVFGIRVVARDGGRLTADAVIARNLMRELEFYLPVSFGFSQLGGDVGDTLTATAGLIWSGVFLALPLFNRDRLRAGDVIAGTWVVKVPRRKLGEELRRRTSEALAFTEAQLDAYGIYELQTLEEVLRNGQHSQLTLVAHTIRTKIVWRGRDDDRVFLTAYYNALRDRLERGLLFGKRREDKLDR